jgi:hypothetical protein
MASQSEKTFGSRLYNAEQLATNLATFTGYVPLTPETAAAAYTTFINQLKTNNTAISTAQANFSVVVDDRQNQFQKSPTSLVKTLPPILAFVKAKFGKQSPQAEEVTRLVNNIRGENTSKLKRNEEGEFVSQSHRSYGSQTQYFADLIATLESYGPAYSPANTTITIENLQDKLEALNEANTQVTTAYGQLKPIKSARITNYETLSQRAQTIKESVKSQYGTQSAEYNLIKGYKI